MQFSTSFLSTDNILQGIHCTKLFIPNIPEFCIVFTLWVKIDHYALVLKPGITVCYDTPSPGHVAYFCLGTEFVSRNAQYF